MTVSDWTDADLNRAEEIWAEYRRHHDLSEKLGQTAGIDPASGRLWFGDSIQDVIAQRDANGIAGPLLFIRVGSATVAQAPLRVDANMSPNCNDDYRSASLFTLGASIFLVAQALIDSLSALFNVCQVQLLGIAASGGQIPLAAADVQDTRQRLLAALAIGIGLLAAVFLLIWLYRAERNARSLGAEGMRYSEGWSVGWFLMPVASLFMPYFVLRELWKASSPNATGEWRRTAVSPILGIWWAVCIIHGMLQYSPIPVLLGDRTLVCALDFAKKGIPNLAVAFREFALGRLISDLVEIAFCVLTVLVVVRIADLQERRAAGRCHTEARRITLRDLVVIMTVWALFLGIAKAMTSTPLAMCQLSLFLFGGFLICLGSARWKLPIAFAGIIVLWMVPLLAFVNQ